MDVGIRQECRREERVGGENTKTRDVVGIYRMAEPGRTRARIHYTLVQLMCLADDPSKRGCDLLNRTIWAPLQWKTPLN